MCSIASDNDVENLATLQEKSNPDFICSKLCRKCSEKACVVLRKKDPLCKMCFQAYCTHKFRATIGKSHQVKPNQKVFVAFSGGAASAALLHMINQGLEEEAHKKFIFKPFLLFIDESPYPGWNEAETNKFHEGVLRQMLSSGHPCYITTIGTSFRDPCSSPAYLQVKSEEDGKLWLQEQSSLKVHLKACLEEIHGISYKEDFLMHLRWNLIRAIADCEKMDFIFSGQCCTYLATQVLTSMALGRGSQVAQDTAFCDSLKGVSVLRPLREFQSKEIAMYNQLNDVQFFIHPTIITKMPPCSSLHQVTEAFVLELQSDFPATVSTIFRTGDKLSYSTGPSIKQCLVCHASVDTDLPDSSAVAALNLSEEISKLQLETEALSPADCCGSCLNSCRSKAKEDFISGILEELCFGCRKIVQSMKSTSVLPPEILHQAQIKRNRQKMRDSIKDFILEED